MAQEWLLQKSCRHRPGGQYPGTCTDDVAAERSVILDSSGQAHGRELMPAWHNSCVPAISKVADDVGQISEVDERRDTWPVLSQEHGTKRLHAMQ